MTFAELLAEREALATWRQTTLEAIQAGCEADLTADFKRTFPKRRWNLSRARECPNQPSILAHWRLKVETVWETVDHELRRLQEQMTVAALAEPIPRTEDLRQVMTIAASSYHTQGFGASRYACGHAEQEADQARYYGIPAEVREVGEAHRDRYGVVYQDYGVFVATTEIGWEMLQHRPGPGLREWVRLCWKRQVNPRVFDAWLPAGLEERLELDCFGNDLRAAAGPAIPAETAAAGGDVPGEAVAV